jgi:response regulator of citrate/malate metabolism
MFFISRKRFEEAVQRAVDERVHRAKVIERASRDLIAMVASETKKPKRKGRGYDGATLRDVTRLVMNDGAERSLAKLTRDVRVLYPKAKKRSIAVEVHYLIKGGELERVKVGAYRRAREARAA